MSKKRQAEHWQEAFQTNITRVTFNLTLSRAMMEMLCALSDDVQWDRTRYGNLLYPDNFLATERALVARGLIVRKLRIAGKDPGGPPFYKLTPVGVACAEMFRVGGCFIEATDARDKLNRRKGKN